MDKKGNLKDYVYQSLKDQIINNHLLPNTFLDEKGICDSLGVSRTPVREALVQLEWEGLVVSVPQRGVMVSDLSLQTVLELIHIRKSIEPDILRPYLMNSYDPEVLLDFRRRLEERYQERDIAGLQQLDYEFHNYLYEATKKRHIIKLMSYINNQLQRIRTQEFYVRRRILGGAQDHIDIIDGLLNHDEETVLRLMQKHVTDMEIYYNGILACDNSDLHS